MKLRPYQEEAVRETIAAVKAGDSALLVLATGCGKTVCFAAMIDELLREEPGKIAVVLAHREELIRQAVDKIERLTCRQCAIEMGELTADIGQTFRRIDVVVSTIQTQNSGHPPRMQRFNPEEVAVVIVDESHHAVSPSYRAVIDYYRAGGAKLIGVTATPDRADEEALGQVFTAAPYVYDVADAIRDGWLVPIRQQMCKVTGLDYSQVRTTAGDLNAGDLSEVMEDEGTLQGIASATRQVVGDRKTLIFTVTVKEADRLAEILNRHQPGCAAAINGGTDKVERARLVRAFAEHKLQYLVNVGVFTEGFDDPGVECVVMARPTKSRSLYAQMLGRGTRPSEAVAGKLGEMETAEERRAAIANSDKPGVLVLDFVGNAGRHKLVTALDILGGKDSDPEAEAVRDRAQKLAEEAGEEGRAVDPEEIAEKAKEELEKEREEAARRVRLRANATYEVVDVSPFYGVLGIDTPMPLPRRYPGKRLTDKQVAALEAFGFKNAAGMDYLDGKRLLDECFRRKEAGEPSYKQIMFIRKIGAEVPATRKEAQSIIGQYLSRTRRGH